MDQRIQTALDTERTIDITTIGRKTGQPRRIEIWFHTVDGQIFITGSPSTRQRDWYQNMVANPEFTFHLKQSVNADLNATATPITDEDARRAWFTRYLTSSGRNRDIEQWVENSPLVEVTFSD